MADTRKFFFRTYNYLEQKLISPTPRKFVNSSSEEVSRKEKRKNSKDSLFGAAGLELQTILLSPISDDNIIDRPERPEKVSLEEENEIDLLSKWPRILESPIDRPPSPPLQTPNITIINTGLLNALPKKTIYNNNLRRLRREIKSGKQRSL